MNNDSRALITLSSRPTRLSKSEGQKCKTINSRYSLVVTHPTTNLPAHGLSTAERTGSPVLHVLWSIAKYSVAKFNIIQTCLLGELVEALIPEVNVHSGCDPLSDLLNDSLVTAWLGPLYRKRVKHSKMHQKKEAYAHWHIDLLR
jgi:hypothetical protein